MELYQEIRILIVTVVLLRQWKIFLTYTTHKAFLRGQSGELISPVSGQLELDYKSIRERRESDQQVLDKCPTSTSRLILWPEERRGRGGRAEAVWGYCERMSGEQLERPDCCLCKMRNIQQVLDMFY